MSLEALNSPPLIGCLTLGCYGVLPVIVRNSVFSSASIPWTVVQGANLAAYGLSFWSVSRPGRYDGQAQIAGDDSEKKGSTELDKMGTGRRGRTLVPPAGWAFAIWGPIFIGELLMVGNQLFLPEDSALAPLIRQVTGPFVLAEVFQSLWTASFRPKYNQGIYKYISFFNLSGIAISLSFCHSSFTKACEFSTAQYMLNFLPLAMHFGWTTAAALVNLNGMYAIQDDVKPRSVAVLGHASVIAATIIGVCTTLSRQAPVYGGVIAWALAAVASGLSKRIEATKTDRQDVVGVLGARQQRLLSIMGAILCAGSSLMVMV